MKAIKPLLLALWLPCCDTSAGGPSPPSASIEVAELGGQRTQSHCVRLPVLFGSHTQDDINVEGRFQLTLFTSNRRLDILLHGASFELGPAHSITVTELESGYSRDLPATSDGGEQFVVSVSSGCS